MKVGEALRLLARKGPAPLYLVAGPEVYLRRGFIERLARHVLGPAYDDGFGLHRIREEDGPLSATGAVLRTVPMFGGRRVVVVEDWEPLTLWAKKATEPAVAALEAVLSYTGPDSVLVFDATRIDQRSAAVKFLHEHGLSVDCQTPDRGEAVNWLIRRAADREQVMERSAAVLMVETVGTELQRLERELDKVLLYAGAGQSVGTAEVQAVVSGEGQWRIFDLLDAVGRQQPGAALQALHRLLTLGEPPLRVLTMMARHVRQLLQVKLMMEQGAAPAAIRSHLRVPAFVARKLQAQASGMDRRQLLSAMEACYETDLSIKTGKLAPGLAVEVLVANLVAQQRAPS